MSFIHLHVYSAYSLLSSTARIEQLVASARENSFPALALTDRNVMYGAVAFYKECLKQSIKPILGLSVDVLSEISEDEAYPLVLLAKNRQGFQNLLKITSTVQTKSPEGIPVKWLKHYAGGLFALTPGMDGEIEQSLMAGEYSQAKRTADLFSSIFEQNSFFLALQDHGLHEEKKIHGSLVKLSEETGIGLAASNGVCYIKKRKLLPMNACWP
ncbi:PHP domain-containing protein [Cytobacillus firmus]|uniref:PHP domain-containing protein n=1 Tax=Cytobacillus firmus TaxID=1399 RepID=UPI00351A7F00